MAGRVGGGVQGGLQGREGVEFTFIQPERVFVWWSKEHAPKQGRIGKLRKLGEKLS